MWVSWSFHMEEGTCYQVSVCIVVLSSQDRKEGREGVERLGGRISSGFWYGDLMVTRVSPMRGCTWELSWCVPYITAAKAVKQSAGLWTGPVARISSGSLPFMQDGKAGDPSTVAQSVAWPRESLDADEGSANKTSILGHFKIKTGAPICKGNVGTQFSNPFMCYIYLF